MIKEFFKEKDKKRIFLLAILFCLFYFEESKSKELNKVNIDYWQTYCASPKNKRHFWSSSKKNYKIKRLDNISKRFRTGYAYLKNESFFLQDIANNEIYEYIDGKYKAVKNIRGCPKASWNGYEISTVNSNAIQACHIKDKSCNYIEIKQNTYLLAVAEKNNSIIAVTNFGDVLLFKEDKWCRMTKYGEIFKCNLSATKVEHPKGYQFYSSIKFENNTLLGEWPTGRIFEFDGEIMAPFVNSPDKSRFNRYSKNYEAQSMAVYCGDLFVGYWPYGEIYRFDSISRKWSRFARLFKSPEIFRFPKIGEPIPYSRLLSKKYPNNEFSSAFLGQRVSALIPYGDSLYAITSNLNSWNQSTSEINFITEQEKRQYGALHKITSPGCFTEKY